jgi:CDP-4-dehydro-6-deoxyglucose reductase
MSNKLTNIRIPKYNLNYEIQNNKNIIDASLDKNIKLAYSCKSGICGTCKARVISGEINKNNKVNHILSNVEKENNIILLCQSTGLSSEITLELLSPLPNEHKLTKARELVSEVLAVKHINKSIIELSISVPKRFSYDKNSNNYIKILIPGIETNDKYPIINSLKEDNVNNGVINILLNKNTKANSYFKKSLIQGETLSIKGPYKQNNTILTNHKPLLFIVENNYIIYSLNIIKELIAHNYNFPIMLICNFENKTDIVLLDEMQRLKFIKKDFSFKISLTNKDNINNIDRFLYGKSINIISKIFPDLSSHCIVINGENKFLNENYNKVIKLGAIKNNIHKKL